MCVEDALPLSSIGRKGARGRETGPSPFQTYGALATIGSLTVIGGTIDVSADNHAAYGALNVTTAMTWTGGTFQAYVNGGDASQRTSITVGLRLTVNASAHLNVNVIGALTATDPWTLLTYNDLAGTLTFDSGGLFTLTQGPTAMTITKR